jgi:hypothetical protein
MPVVGVKVREHHDPTPCLSGVLSLSDSCQHEFSPEVTTMNSLSDGCQYKLCHNTAGFELSYSLQRTIIMWLKQRLLLLVLISCGLIL